MTMEKILIPIDEINPYDGNHPPTEEGWKEVDEITKGEERSSKKYHDEGIEKVKNGILNGGEITPMAVRLTQVVYYDIKKKYERLDGFKRFMGCKEAGLKEIPCYVCDGPSATPGMQFGIPMFEVEPKEPVKKVIGSKTKKKSYFDK